MIEDLLVKYAELGFAYLVSGFLLWKGYTQDQEYLKTLTQIQDQNEQILRSLKKED